MSRITCVMLRSGGGGGLFPAWPRVSEAILERSLFGEKQQFKVQGKQVVQYDIKRDHKRHHYSKHP
jgi:hypothetical protein